MALTKRLFIPPPSLDIFAEPPPLGISLPGLFLRLFRTPPPLSCRRFTAAVALLTNPCHHAVLPCCYRHPIVDTAPQPRSLLVLPQPPSGQGRSASIVPSSSRCDLPPARDAVPPFSGGARNLQLGMPSKYNHLTNVITARERWPMGARTRGAGAARRSLE